MGHSTLLALGLLVLVSPARVVAQPLIHACAKAQDGSLRLVGDPLDCKSRETPLSWNQQGTQGEPGLDGIDGLDGLDGVPGPTGPSFRVFDGTGTEIGPLVDWSQDGESISVYLRNIGAYTELSTRTGLLQDENSSAVYFGGAGCTGQPYLETGGKGAASRLFSPIIEGTERYFVGSNELAEMVTVGSFASFGREGNATCGGDTGTGLRTVLADEISLEALGLSFPLPLPIYIAPGPD